MASTTSSRFDRRDALLDAWVERQRAIAVLQSEAAALLAERWELWREEVTEHPMHRDAIERSMIAEYSAAGHISKGTMEFAFTDARTLHEDFPLIRRSHQQGLISAAHVREILREAQPVGAAVRSQTAAPETLTLYEAAVLEVAEADTPARTRAHARRIAAALAGSTVVEQHTRAASERAVTVRSVGDGMALLQAVLPEHLALAIHDRLTAMARHLSQHPEDRASAVSVLTDADEQWARLVEQALHAQDEAQPGREASHLGRAQRADDAGAIFSTQTFAVDPFAASALTDDRRADDDLVPSCLPPEVDVDSDPDANPDSPLLLHLPADTRTLDQQRADLFADLLLSCDPSDAHGTGLENIRATIQVTVAATTLIGADDRPAELDGHGPLHPKIARSLAGSRTGWTRLFLDPSGLVTETDTYTPTEPMRRFLRARDQHCRFPGCRQPVHRCDIDHHHDHALGGRTSTDNLAHFCRAHHVLKHPDLPGLARWTARQLPDGAVQWTSPSGRRYPDPAPRRVMFTPSEGVAPVPSASRPTGSPPPGSRPPGSPPPRPPQFTFTTAALTAEAADAPF